MGLIYGEYEAKKDGFLPGGASYHPFMTPHGPDAKTFQAASDTSKPQVPERVADGTMAFMFESSLMLGVSPWALKSSGVLQPTYAKDSWAGLKKQFNPDKK
jgi:homogentisate 1,2-dioxygenase